MKSCRTAFLRQSTLHLLPLQPKEIQVRSAFKEAPQQPRANSALPQRTPRTSSARHAASAAEPEPVPAPCRRAVTAIEQKHRAAGLGRATATHGTPPPAARASGRGLPAPPVAAGPGRRPGLGLLPACLPSSPAGLVLLAAGQALQLVGPERRRVVQEAVALTAAGFLGGLPSCRGPGAEAAAVGRRGRGGGGGGRRGGPAAEEALGAGGGGGQGAVAAAKLLVLLLQLLHQFLQLPHLRVRVHARADVLHGACRLRGCLSGEGRPRRPVYMAGRPAALEGGGGGAGRVGRCRLLSGAGGRRRARIRPPSCRLL